MNAIDYKSYETKFGGVPEETEINKLIKMLNDQGGCCPIDWKVVELYGRPQVIFLNPQNGELIGDAVCHFESYGHERGLIEVMGFPFCDQGDVVGFLTADEVIHQIEVCC